MVESRPDGGVEMFPMRSWCLSHPAEMPPHLNVKQVNSHRIRDELRRIGWSVETTETHVLMMRPGFTNFELVQETLGTEDEVDEGEESVEALFGLEAQLQAFLEENIERIQINGKRLKLYVDPDTGVNGIEFRTPVGRIDVLAEDSDGGLIVIELKRATAPDHAIGQLARYMGWLKKTIARDRNVHGVIVAQQINANLRYSIAAVPNISLFEYRVSFTLNQIEEANG